MRALLPLEKCMAKMTTVKEMNEKAPIHKTDRDLNCDDLEE